MTEYVFGIAKRFKVVTDPDVIMYRHTIVYCREVLCVESS